jgi:uncharacterized protein (DUF433 family)
VTTIPRLESCPVPLDRLPNGAIRVGGTRIGLDAVINAHNRGETPEEIVEAYDSLRLADVYTLIDYYRSHREEVDEYIRANEVLADEVRRKIQAELPPRPGFFEELKARWARREAERNAATRSDTELDGTVLATGELVDPIIVEDDANQAN